VLNRFAAYFGKPRQQELPQSMLSQQPLYPRAPMLQEFPLDVWRRLIAARPTARPTAITWPTAPRRTAAPARAIARHLSLVRATPVRPQQVVVTHSATQAFELLAAVLLEPGDKVWLEDPGHGGLISLFQVLGMQVVGVPLDAEGLCVEAGHCAGAGRRAGLLPPDRAVPDGRAHDAAAPRRAAALGRWQRRLDREGNFNDEIIYDRQSPGALWSMEESDRVLMLGTLEA
jgi:GntR family transcriptional regulator/MocR family aminotransferase